MKFVLLPILLFSVTGFAGTLLLPGPEIEFEKYKALCKTTKYTCTTDYFVNHLRLHKTEEFDRLMDEVDLNSQEFRMKFQNKIISILNTEELDRTQLAMLIQLLQQMNKQQHIVFYKLIENELRRIQVIIEKSAQNNTTTCQKEFVFFFKEIISPEDSEKLRTTFLKIPLYQIHFTSLPLRSNSAEFARQKRKFLLAGNCGAGNFNFNMKTAKICSRKPEAPEALTPAIRARYD